MSLIHNFFSGALSVSQRLLFLYFFFFRIFRILYRIIQLCLIYFLFASYWIQKFIFNIITWIFLFWLHFVTIQSYHKKSSVFQFLVFEGKTWQGKKKMQQNMRQKTPFPGIAFLFCVSLIYKWKLVCISQS